MQPGSWFIEHQTGSVKLRTEDCSESRALKFSARQRSRRTIKRQISDTDIIQTLQAGSNVRQCAFRNQPGFLGERSFRRSILGRRGSWQAVLNHNISEPAIDGLQRIEDTQFRKLANRHRKKRDGRRKWLKS